MRKLNYYLTAVNTTFPPEATTQVRHQAPPVGLELCPVATKKMKLLGLTIPAGPYYVGS